MWGWTRSGGRWFEPGLCRHVVSLDKKLYSTLSLFTQAPETGSLYSPDQSLSSAGNVFRLMLLARFLRRSGPDSYTFTFVLYKIRMATSSSSYIFCLLLWVAAYPVDNAIHPPFEQLGQVYKWVPAMLISLS